MHRPAPVVWPVQEKKPHISSYISNETQSLYLWNLYPTVWKPSHTFSSLISLSFGVLFAVAQRDIKKKKTRVGFYRCQYASVALAKGARVQTCRTEERHIEIFRRNALARDGEQDALSVAREEERGWRERQKHEATSLYCCPYKPNYFSFHSILHLHIP